MILHILEVVYSRQFLFGAIAGSIVWKLYCYTKAHYEDKHHPLPGGRKHAQARMSRVWLAGLSALLSLGYVLLITGHTEQHTETLNRNVTTCWHETYLQLKAQVEINAENDGISRQQQVLQRQYDEDTANWLKDLVNPPGDLATEPSNSPDRQAYALQRTAEYQGQLDDLGKQFDDLVNQRKDLDRQREAHPLPEAKCGRS